MSLLFNFIFHCSQSLRELFLIAITKGTARNGGREGGREGGERMEGGTFLNYIKLALGIGTLFYHFHHSL